MFDRAASLLNTAHAGGAAISALSQDAIPATLSDGYLVQARLIERIGRPVIGWKQAVATEASQAANGLSAPTVGPLLSGMVVEEGTVFAPATFRQPVIEPEIAVVLARDLRGPADAAAVRAATATLRLAIEIADTRFVRKDVHGQPGIVADLNCAGALVLGPKVGTGALDAEITVTLGDGARVAGFAPADRPDPFAVVAFLAGFLAQRGLWLRAGDVVTTGTCAPPTRTAPGRVSCAFAGFGEVAATIVS